MARATRTWAQPWWSRSICSADTAAVAVQDRQAHQVEDRPHRSDLFDLENPARGQPGPGTPRVEPEVDGRRLDLGRLGVASSRFRFAASSIAASPSSPSSFPTWPPANPMRAADRDGDPPRPSTCKDRSHVSEQPDARRSPGPCSVARDPPLRHRDRPVGPRRGLARRTVRLHRADRLHRSGRRIQPRRPDRRRRLGRQPGRRAPSTSRASGVRGCPSTSSRASTSSR